MTDASAVELRTLLADLPGQPSGYGPWWGSARADGLLALAQRLAPAVALAARRRTGLSVDPDVVLGLLVDALAPPSQLRRALLAPSTADPVAYLCRSLANALARELGPEATIDPSVPRSLAALPPSPAGRPSRRLDRALRAVLRALDPRTPRRLRPTLEQLVEHVVDRAADGALSRLHTRIAADAGLHERGWTPAHLRALVNAVIGARPDHARTSLVAGFLIDPEWRPSASPTHRAALAAYERRMARAEASLRDGERRTG